MVPFPLHFSSFDVASISDRCVYLFVTSKPQQVWLYYSNSIHQQVSLFINSSTNLVPFSHEFAIVFRYFFGIDFDINLCIDFVDFHGPKMDPWDNVLNPNVGKNYPEIKMQNASIFDTPDRLWRSAVPTKTPEGHGPNMCIGPHRACWHAKCVRVGCKRF